MILKEAFRYQNYLENLANQCVIFLANNQNICTIKQIHNKHKANSDATDEEIIVEHTSELTANQVIDFCDVLINEKIAVTNAISKAKRECEDIDLLISINKFREKFNTIFKNLSDNVKPEKTQTYGTDYKFNANGDQMAYKYIIDNIKTIDFDRNNVKKMYKTWKKLVLKK